MVPYLDLHCDTLRAAALAGLPSVRCAPGLMVDAERLRRGGAGGQYFGMFFCQTDGPEVPPPDELMAKMLAVYRETLRECADTFAPARGFADWEKNRRAGKISAFLSIENAYAANGDLNRLNRWREEGVSLAALTWNHANCLGFPHSADPAESARGLTEFGREAVARMNELGLIVDVSHLSDGGFRDVAALSAKPFVASHSNCRALAPRSRNLSDGMLRTLAGRGGVAGLNFYPPFLNASAEDMTGRVERMCEHVEHVVAVAGEDCPALGTDFDGIEGELEIPGCEGMPRLFDALRRRGLTERQLEKLACGNFLRVLRENCP